MKLAFYKANAPGKTLADTLIDFFTGGGGYSHTELVFSDGMCFSCSPREDACRFKKINIFDEETWDLVDLNFTTEEEVEIRKLASLLVGRRYDWLGIFLHQFLPLGIQSDKKFWCTEVCLFLVGRIPYRVSPNSAAKTYNLI